ncbi:MAG: DUF1835 domain-containing protein [Bacteroidales bacterium]|nr:DUF1835 domain-containing protein [Bacteroidales bacterium]MCM1416220.1 DUF1835 domain-containing protein [bacterium]MCM1424232.1 DUF1835 domain-containing protein [bacterium]
MIEVLFGESEAASMKAAKNTVITMKADGPTAVWTVGKKKLPEKENCGWIEGTAEEVICLGFLLDVGDIRESADSDYRRHMIYSMYAQKQWKKGGEMDTELMQPGDHYCAEMERLEAYLADGAAIRVWYSEAPYSICGFYHLCTGLQKYQNEISVVKLPEYKIRSDHSTVSYKNWGEVAAEEFAGFLTYEKKLSGEEIRMYAMLWNVLQEDNSPLRAVINGKLIGVPEDFYDFLIWKKITRKPIKEARLIGNILGENQLGVGDWWYVKRIDYFIQIGKINIVEDSKNKYARTICLA